MKSLAELLPNRPQITTAEVVTEQDVCPKCDGDGYIGYKSPDNYPIEEVKFCDCEIGYARKQQWEKRLNGKKKIDLDVMLDAAGIPTRYRRHRISDWEGDNQWAVIFARSFAESGCIVGKLGGKRNSIYVYSDYGYGKTSLMSAAMIGWMQVSGMSGLFVKGSQILGEAQATYNKESKLSLHDVIMRYSKCPLLMIDEFGNAFQEKELSEDKISIFTSIVAYRYDWELPTLMTSNLSLDALSEQLKTPQLTDRIIQTYGVCMMTGKNHRLPTKVG